MPDVIDNAVVVTETGLDTDLLLQLITLQETTVSLLYILIVGLAVIGIVFFMWVILRDIIWAD